MSIDCNPHVGGFIARNLFSVSPIVTNGSSAALVGAVSTSSTASPRDRVTVDFDREDGEAVYLCRKLKKLHSKRRRDNRSPIAEGSSPKRLDGEGVDRAGGPLPEHPEEEFGKSMKDIGDLGRQLKEATKEVEQVLYAPYNRGRLKADDEVRIRKQQNRARKAVFACIERIHAIGGASRGGRDRSALYDQVADGAYRDALSRLARVEFPVLFANGQPAEIAESRDALLEGLVTLCKNKMLGPKVLRLLAFDHSVLTDIPDSGHVNWGLVRARLKSFRTLIDNANRGELPDEIFAYVPEHHDLIADLYEKAASIKGLLPRIGRLQAECLFAKALALQHVGGRVDVGNRTSTLGLSSGRQKKLLRDPKPLLDYIKDNIGRFRSINLLAAQIAIWQDEIEIYEQRRLANRYCDISETCRELAGAWDAAAAVVEAKGDLNAADEAYRQFRRQHRLETGGVFPPALADTVMQYEADLHAAESRLMAAEALLADAGGMPVQRISELPGRRKDRTGTSRDAVNAARPNRHPARLRDVAAGKAGDRDAGRGVKAARRSGADACSGPKQDKGRRLETAVIAKDRNTGRRGGSPVISRRDPRSIDAVVRDFLDPAALSELGLPDPGLQHVERVINRLYEADLISTEQVKEANRHIEQLHGAIVRRDTLDGFLRFACFPVALILYSLSLFASGMHGVAGRAGHGQSAIKGVCDSLTELEAAASGPKAIQGAISRITTQTDEQLSARFEDVLYRWVAGDDHHGCHNLKISDDAVGNGLKRKIRDAGGRLCRSGGAPALQGRLLDLQRVNARIRALAETDEAGLHDAQRAVHNIREGIGGLFAAEDFALLKLAIHAAILGARPKTLDAGYVRMNRFDATDYAREIDETLLDLGVAQAFGLEPCELEPLVDSYICSLPTIRSTNRREIDAVVGGETFRATDLNMLLGELTLLVGGDIGKALGIEKQNLWLDKLLSSVRSVPIQQKTTAMVVTEGTTSSFSALLNFALKPILGPLGVSLDIFGGTAHLIEVKRGLDNYEVRIRNGNVTGKEGSLKASLFACAGAADVGEIDMINEGICLQFSSVDDVQRFLDDMFRESRVSTKTWLDSASKMEITSQRASRSSKGGVVGAMYGARIGPVEANAVSAEVGLGYASLELDSSYRSRFRVENKHKDIDGHFVEASLRLANFGATGVGTGKQGSGGDFFGGSAASAFSSANTGLACSQSARSIWLKRGMEARNFEGVLMECGRIAAIPVTGTDPLKVLELFGKAGMPDTVAQFVEALDGDDAFRNNLQRELDKAQENDLLVIEQKMKPEILELIQMWEERIAFGVRRLGGAPYSGVEAGSAVSLPNGGDTSMQALKQSIAKMHEMIDRLRRDENSFQPKAVMIVPKRDIENGRGVNLALFYVSRAGAAANRQPAAFIPVPDRERKAVGELVAN